MRRLWAAEKLGLVVNDFLQLRVHGNTTASGIRCSERQKSSYAVLALAVTPCRAINC